MERKPGEVEMKRGQFVVAGLVALTALALSACGSSPTSPGAAAGVTLRGVATGSGVGLAAANGVQGLSTKTAAGGTSSIVVTVQESPSLTTTISGNGTFELDGLPAGTFTLVFTSNGVTIGTITITSVPNQAEVDLVVQISLTNVVVVTVKVNGNDETANQTQTPTKTCLIEGGTVGARIELEGSIAKATGKTFEMSVNGQRAGGTVAVDASGAGFDCAGIKGTCDATLIATGAKVHVSGNLTSCSLTAAQVKATQVKFQH
jgi:hypothetical protein